MSTKVVVKKGLDIGVTKSAKDIPIGTFFMGRLPIDPEPCLFCRASGCVVCIEGLSWTAVSTEISAVRFYDYRPVSEIEIAVKK